MRQDGMTITNALCANYNQINRQQQQAIALLLTTQEDDSSVGLCRLSSTQLLPFEHQRNAKRRNTHDEMPRL